jgi:hypothetical protein
MQIYLDCMKKARNDNSLCREESKNYLECRMSRYVPAVIWGEWGVDGRGLMLRDSLRNLGFEAEKVREEKSKSQGT